MTRNKETYLALQLNYHRSLGPTPSLHMFSIVLYEKHSILSQA